MKKRIVLILFLLFFCGGNNTASANPFDQLLCVMTGGKWVDGECVKEQPPLPPEVKTYIADTSYQSYLITCKENCALSPILTFTIPVKKIKCSAMYVLSGIAYLAVQKLTGRVEFERFYDGDSVIEYTTATVINNKWKCTIFEDVFGEMDLGVLDRCNVIFIISVENDARIAQGVQFRIERMLRDQGQIR